MEALEIEAFNHHLPTHYRRTQKMDSIRLTPQRSVEEILEPESESPHNDLRLGELLVRALQLMEQLKPELHKVSPKLRIQIENNIEKVRGIL